MVSFTKALNIPNCCRTVTVETRTGGPTSQCEGLGRLRRPNQATIWLHLRQGDPYNRVGFLKNTRFGHAWMLLSRSFYSFRYVWLYSNRVVYLSTVKQDCFAVQEYCRYSDYVLSLQSLRCARQSDCCSHNLCLPGNPIKVLLHVHSVETFTNYFTATTFLSNWDKLVGKKAQKDSILQDNSFSVRSSSI